MIQTAVYKLKVDRPIDAFIAQQSFIQFIIASVMKKAAITGHHLKASAQATIIRNVYKKVRLPSLICNHTKTNHYVDGEKVDKLLLHTCHQNTNHHRYKIVELKTNYHI